MTTVEIKEDLMCPSCCKLLTKITTSGSYKLKCEQCSEIYPVSNDNTLVYHESDKNELNDYKVLLANAGKDILNERVELVCGTNNCKGEFAREVRITNDMRLYNVCEKCNKISLNKKE